MRKKKSLDTCIENKTVYKDALIERAKEYNWKVVESKRTCEGESTYQVDVYIYSPVKVIIGAHKSLSAAYKFALEESEDYLPESTYTKVVYLPPGRDASTPTNDVARR